MSLTGSPTLDLTCMVYGHPKSPFISHAATFNLQPLEPPSREDWERFKTTIIGKYLGMNAPLHEIVVEMEQYYGFKATQRMYKQRFTEWNIYKYKKVVEKRIAKARSAQGSMDNDDADSVAMSRWPSATTCSPMPFDDSSCASQPTEDGTCDEAARCAHRHCIQAFLLQLEQHYNATSGLYQQKTSFSLLDIGPKRIGSVDQVLYCVQQFSESWMASDSQVHQHHISDAAAKAAKITSAIKGHCSHRSSPKQCERCTWAEFDFGLSMLEDRHTDLALTSFELGCRLAHLLLSSPSKLFIRNLIMAFGSTRWDQFKPFRQKLLEYLALMASVVLGQKHPITIILENVACGDTLAASAEFSLRLMLQLFERAYHSAHPDVLLIKRSLSVILRRQRDYHASEEILQSAIKDSSSYNGYDSKETRRCFRRLGHLYMEQCRYEEANTVFQTILKTAPGKSVYQESWIPDEISVYTYQHLARMANEVGDQIKCRFWFLKELDAAIKRWGVDGEYTAECLQLAYNEIPSAVEQYPAIFDQAAWKAKGAIVISKARWCAVRNLI